MLCAARPGFPGREFQSHPTVPPARLYELAPLHSCRVSIGGVGRPGDSNPVIIPGWRAAGGARHLHSACPPDRWDVGSWFGGHVVFLHLLLPLRWLCTNGHKAPTDGGDCVCRRWGISCRGGPRMKRAARALGPAPRNGTSTGRRVCRVGHLEPWTAPRVACSAARAGGEGGVACLEPRGLVAGQGRRQRAWPVDLGATWGSRLGGRCLSRPGGLALTRLWPRVGTRAAWGTGREGVASRPRSHVGQSTRDGGVAV